MTHKDKSLVIHGLQLELELTVGTVMAQHALYGVFTDGEASHIVNTLRKVIQYLETMDK